LNQDPWHPINEVEEKKSSTYGPASLLQSSHLAPAPNAVVDNDKSQQHDKKQNSPDLKNDEKIKPTT
jgi:hypothetical protein